MIPSIAQQGPTHHMAHRRGAGGPEASPPAESTLGARAASAPGQIAKTMIADAIASGAELPANIQGKAASAIARGMNMGDIAARTGFRCRDNGVPGRCCRQFL